VQNSGEAIRYGQSYGAFTRRAAFHVDKTLRCAKVSELHIEQLTTLSLAIYWTTAKKLGLMIPDELRANDNIE